MNSDTTDTYVKATGVLGVLDAAEVDHKMGDLLATLNNVYLSPGAPTLPSRSYPEANNRAKRRREINETKSKVAKIDRKQNRKRKKRDRRRKA